MRKLIEPFLNEIGQVIANEASKASRKSLPDIISISLTIVFLLLAIIGSMITLYMYLSEIFLDRYAMFIVTLTVLVLAGLSFVFVKKTFPSEQYEQDNAEDLNEESSRTVEMATSMGVEVAK